MGRYFAVVALIVLLGGCGGEAPSGNAAETGNESAPPAPVRQLPAAEQLNRAFAVAFGRAPPARLAVDDQTYDFRPERLEWIGDRAALISVGENVDNSHVASGTMAIHYLVPAGDGFRVSGAWPTAMAGGTNGLPSQSISLNRELSDHPVVSAEGGATAQGYTCGWVLLVELRPDRPVASEPVPVAMTNEGAVMEETGRTFGGEPRRMVEGRIGNVRRNLSFDVNFTGTERFAESYDYRDGRFVPRAAESRAQC